jgi:hypothetical protein
MRRLLVVLAALLSVTLSACGGGGGGRGPAATVSAGQVEAIAANLLAAYSSGDYEAFSRDWSLPARLIVDEPAFAELRAENLPITGPYEVVTEVRPAPGHDDAGHVGYLVRARFQRKSGVRLTLTVTRATGEIEGLELNPRREW